MNMIRRARRAGAVLVFVIIAAPASAFAEDKWFAADKARHFGAGAGIGAGGYAVAVPLTENRRWRIVLGTGAGAGAGAVKELRDRRRGQPSWRDFTWSAAGGAAGALIAWIVDKAAD
jgi:uncharacterized protein YfiM (DUF2279 family)